MATLAGRGAAAGHGLMGKSGAAVRVRDVKRVSETKKKKS